MILPEINGDTGLKGRFFFFAADTKYFDLYGKALCLSLKEKASWAQIHVHLYNPTLSQLQWCTDRGVTRSFEIIDPMYPEFKTYCACVRFIRIPEIFDNSSKIISFDCDVIANKNIPESKFLEDTQLSKVTIKKNGRSLASAISFGPDNFRHVYRNQLIENFKTDRIYWFLDQDVLDDIIAKGAVSTMEFNWTGTKMTDSQMIWTAKGDRKFEKAQYLKLVEYYNSKS